jgi:hypothetical protein
MVKFFLQIFWAGVQGELLEVLGIALGGEG